MLREVGKEISQHFTVTALRAHDVSEQDPAFGGHCHVLASMRLRPIIAFVTTISPAVFRRNMASWLSRVVAGEDIGILFGDKVIALRPVEVESTDYAEKEVVRATLKNHRR